MLTRTQQHSQLKQQRLGNQQKESRQKLCNNKHSNTLFFFLFFFCFLLLLLSTIWKLNENKPIHFWHNSNTQHTIHDTTTRVMDSAWTNARKQKKDKKKEKKSKKKERREKETSNTSHTFNKKHYSIYLHSITIPHSWIIRATIVNKNTGQGVEHSMAIRKKEKWESQESQH